MIRSLECVPAICFPDASLGEERDQKVFKAVSARRSSVGDTLKCAEKGNNRKAEAVTNFFLSAYSNLHHLQLFFDKSGPGTVKCSKPSSCHCQNPPRALSLQLNFSVMRIRTRSVGVCGVSRGHY